ncbi:PKD domain-containing protein [Ruminiclostridium herbifermentans]|uniref:PKD domain-containing protein n=2 Tax=Ruminiclostridium herbifermentans TaxID=2488810 RepID=A0A7H1VSE7_9FIRM|nr:PKD domain-containing protein [Ruminiclostridium herbifermentans]
MSIYIPVNAGFDEKKLRIDTDNAKHQALSMTVDSIPSNSPLQAFCIGWNFTFSNEEVSSTPVSVYVPLSSVNTSGGTRTYTFPLTTGWTREFTGIAGGKSIRDLVSNKRLYDKIIKAGCTVHANAKILKYKYIDGKPTPMGTYSNGINSPPNVFADCKDDIEYIDSKGIKHGNFTEFSETFKENTKSEYFDLSLTLAAEPLPPPDVVLNLPEDNSTVIQGTTVTIKGIGTGCHHIGAFVDGKFYGTEQKNPNEDINIPMEFETKITLDQVKDYTFQIKGRNTELASDKDSVLAESKIHTVHVIAPKPNSGNIYIKCIDYNTNSILSSSTLPNIPYDMPKEISSPALNNYSIKGSYSTYTGSIQAIPSIAVMQSNVISQIVTLSDSNPNAYVYFWYQELKRPKAIIDAPEKVKAGNEFTVSGVRSYCRQADAVIKSYSWSTGLDKVSGNISFANPGKYTITLTVTDSNGLTDSTTHEIEVMPPTPVANINLSGKIKENRKITISARMSDTPDRYPIIWSKTKWYIEPVIGTGATWDFGVKLRDGTVIKISSNSDQALLNGQDEFYFQARNSGVYRVTLSITNSYPANDTIKGTITVNKDEPPIVILEAPKVNLREYDNPIDSTKSKFGKIEIQDKSYSPDGDIIGKRYWYCRYNSDNNIDAKGNSDFSDEADQHIFADDITSPFLPEEKIRLIVDNENDTIIELWWYDVGKYRIELIAEEYIPEDETIKELLIPSDIRRTIATGW